MLPSSDHRITSKVKAEPVDPAMAVEPTGPSVKAEPTEPSMKDKVKKQEEDEMNSQLTEKDSASPMKGNPGKPLDSQQSDEGRVGTKSTAVEENQKIEAANPSRKGVNQAVHSKVEPMDPDLMAGGSPAREPEEFDAWQAAKSSAHATKTEKPPTAEAAQQTSNATMAKAGAKGIIKQLQLKRKREEMASSTSTVGGLVAGCRQQYATIGIPHKKIRKGSQAKVIRIAGKQSGVSNVTWIATKLSWKVQWRKTQLHSKAFTVSKYMLPGSSAQQADHAALKEAVAFRNKLVEDGIIKPKVSTKPSGIRGVTWNSKCRSWAALTYDSGGKPKNRLFRPDDETPEADEKARLAAVECRRQWELKHLHIDHAQLPPDLSQKIEKRAQGIKGVRWNKRGRCFEVNLPDKNGKRRRESFKAWDLTPGEIERAKKLAVKRRLKFVKTGM